MSRRLVKSVRLAGFLSIRETEVELRPLNLLVGANGAGKSNYIKAIELLGRMGRGDLGLHVGRAGGASNLLCDGSRQILLAMDAEDAGYTAMFEPAADDSLIFSREVVRGVGVLASGHAESGLRPQVFEEKAALDHLVGFRAYHFRNTSADAPVRVNTDLEKDPATARRQRRHRDHVVRLLRLSRRCARDGRPVGCIASGAGPARGGGDR